MNDLKLEHNRATLTADENEGGIVMRITETTSKAQKLDTTLYPNVEQAQIWLDKRAICRLYAFLRDVMPDQEDLNGEEID